MKWAFIYYSSRVQQSVHFFAKRNACSMKKIMEERGPVLGMPYTRAMGDGLFEMRLRDKGGIARVFYGTVEKQEIIILHSFIKKTQKTPIQELQLARKRLKEVRHG